MNGIKSNNQDQIGQNLSEGGEASNIGSQSLLSGIKKEPRVMGEKIIRKNLIIVS